MSEPFPVLASGWNNHRTFLFPTPRGPGNRAAVSVACGRGRLHWLLYQTLKIEAAGAALRAARGDILSFQDDREGQPKRHTDPDSDQADHASPRSRKKKQGNGNEVGDALRSAYQRMVNEDIPPEMLDLLGKLG